METLTFLFLALILIALREGMVLSNPEKYDREWHLAGWAIRGCIIAVIVMLTKPDYWAYFIPALILAWPVYNITINLFKGMKWYYVSDKGIDKLIRKTFWFVNFDK